MFICVSYAPVSASCVPLWLIRPPLSERTLLPAASCPTGLGGPAGYLFSLFRLGFSARPCRPSCGSAARSAHSASRLSDGHSFRCCAVLSDAPNQELGSVPLMPQPWWRLADLREKGFLSAVISSTVLLLTSLGAFIRGHGCHYDPGRTQFPSWPGLS